jgi:RNA polymerase sigma-70 factor (ECF subfamily)
VAQAGPQKVDDRLLVERACQGDAEAFGALVGLYGGRVFNLVAYMCSDRDLADDLTQETFLKAFRSLDSYKGEANFYTWLYRIAANTVLSSRRRRQLRERFEGKRSADPRSTARAQDDPPGAVERAERSRIVQEAIGRLAPQEAAVIVMRDMESLSYGEIAGALDIPAGTVRSRLFRARLALRDILKGRLGEL